MLNVMEFKTWWGPKENPVDIALDKVQLHRNWSGLSILRQVHFWQPVVSLVMEMIL